SIGIPRPPRPGTVPPLISTSAATIARDSRSTERSRRRPLRDEQEAGGGPSSADRPPHAPSAKSRNSFAQLSSFMRCLVALEEPLRLVDRAEDVPVVVHLHHGEVFLHIAAGVGQHGLASGAADLSCDRHEDAEKAGPGFLDSSQLDDVIANSLLEHLADVAGGIDVSWVVHQPCEVAEDCDVPVHADVHGHEDSPRCRGFAGSLDRWAPRLAEPSLTAA